QNDTKLMQKGFDLLEVVEETELKAKLLKELQYYRQRK
ncbi:TPA: Rgg/GadR/MutR family transcriptional regulator, partial [Enterococcus faecium]